MALRINAETLLFGVPEDTQRQLLAAPQVRATQNPSQVLLTSIYGCVSNLHIPMTGCCCAGLPQHTHRTLSGAGQAQPHQPDLHCRRRARPARRSARCCLTRG